jgi:hypothetical protein
MTKPLIQHSEEETDDIVDKLRTNRIRHAHNYLSVIEKVNA